MIKLVLIFIFLLFACSEEQFSIKQGEKLFHQVHIGKNNVIGCISCHSLKPDIKTVGPSLYGLKYRAGKLVDNLTAQQYVAQSIINPDSYIVSGYMPAVMFPHYSTELSNYEIRSIVVFLINL